MESTSLFQMHEEHKLWLNNLTIYRDELKDMLDRLSEIAKKNPSKEIQVGIEHFQNQFIIQNEQMDILIHNVKLHEEFLEREAHKIDAAIDHREFPHMNEEMEIDTFERIFNNLRKEFNVFFARCIIS